MGDDLSTVDWRKGPPNYSGGLNLPEGWKLKISKATLAIFENVGSTTPTLKLICIDLTPKGYTVEKYDIQIMDWRRVALCDNLNDAYHTILVLMNMGV